MNTEESLLKKLGIGDKIRAVIKGIIGYGDKPKFTLGTRPIIKKYTDIELMNLALIEEKLKKTIDKNKKESIFMKIILCADVKGQGKKNDVIDESHIMNLRPDSLGSHQQVVGTISPENIIPYLNIARLASIAPLEDLEREVVIIVAEETIFHHRPFGVAEIHTIGVNHPPYLLDIVNMHIPAIKETQSPRRRIAEHQTRNINILAILKIDQNATRMLSVVVA